MPKKNKHLRFGITDHIGNRAATWTVTIPNSKSDIYISCRELSGSIKVSLHKSGSWHIGYSKGASAKYFDSEKVKYIEIWPRPQPFVPGVTLAFRIVTPYSSVKTPINEVPEDIFWISNCEEGFATEIDFILTSSETITNDWPGKNKMGTRLIGSFRLESGDTLWVIYWTIPMPDLSDFGSKQFQFYKGKGKEDLSHTNLRALAFSNEKDGSRTIFDCAVQCISK